MGIDFLSLDNKNKNIGQQNKDGKDLFIYLVINNYYYKSLPCYFDFIQFISSLSPFSSRLISNNYLDFQKRKFSHSSIVFGLLFSCDFNLIKFTDQFSSFSKYFDGENKTTTKNSILFDVTQFYLSKSFIEFSFKSFNEIFEYFLHKRNNINSIGKSNQLLIHRSYEKTFISWKFILIISLKKG